LPTWLFHFRYALLLWIPFDCAPIWWSVVKYFNSLDLQFFLQFFLIHVFYCFKYSLLEVSSALLALFFSLYLLFILQWKIWNKSQHGVMLKRSNFNFRVSKWWGCMTFFGRPVWNKTVLDTKDSGFEVKVVFTFL
jgi:hypothetical protein